MSEPARGERSEEGRGGGVFRELELDPDVMRALGYRVVDLLVERWTELPRAPAWSGGTRAELERELLEAPPEEGREADAVLERAVAVLERAGRIDHPRFLAFVPSSPTWPGVLGDFLAAGYNVFQGTWLESAGPSALELVVLEWFRTWLGLPAGAGGLLTSGGSAANLLALVAARERAGDPDGPAVFVGDQGHSSLERAARIAGIGAGAVVRIPSDEDFRMDPEALVRALRASRDRGRRPVCVCASAGSTSTGAVDPLAELAAICRDEEVWFHVDGAYGGFAVLDPRVRPRFRGIEEADSVTLDPHKWLFQPYEVGCLMAQDPGYLESAFRVLPDYLQDTRLGSREVNFADRGLQLSRSFRALKIWMSVQMLGLGAFRDAIAHGVSLARRAEERIRRSPWLELLSPASLGVVCYRFNPRDGASHSLDLDELNARLNDRVSTSGYAMVSSTRLGERFSLRLCVLNHRSRWSDVEGTLDRVVATGRELLLGS